MILRDIQKLSENNRENASLRIVGIRSPEKMGRGYSSEFLVRAPNGTTSSVRIGAGALMTIGIGAKVEYGRVILLNKKSNNEVKEYKLLWNEKPIKIADIPDELKIPNEFIDWRYMHEEYCYHIEKDGIHYILPYIEVHNTLYAISTEFSVWFCRGEDIKKLCKNQITLSEDEIFIEFTQRLKRRVIQDWEYFFIESIHMGSDFQNAQKVFQETGYLRPQHPLGMVECSGLPLSEKTVLITSFNMMNQNNEPKFKTIHYSPNQSRKKEHNEQLATKEEKAPPTIKIKVSEAEQTKVAGPDAKVREREKAKTAETGREPLMDRSKQIVKAITEKLEDGKRFKINQTPARGSELAPVLAEEQDGDDRIGGVPRVSLQAVSMECVNNIPDEGFYDFKKMLKELTKLGCELSFVQFFPENSKYNPKRSVAIVGILAFNKYFQIFEASRDEKPLLSSQIWRVPRNQTEMSSQISSQMLSELFDQTGHWGNCGKMLTALRHGSSNSTSRWTKRLIAKMKDLAMPFLD